MTTDTGKPTSEHVAVSHMVLFGGHTRELIHVDKAFLIAAIQDALSWCHEVETPSGPGRTSGKLADYDAALAVLEEPPLSLAASLTLTGNRRGPGSLPVNACAHPESECRSFAEVLRLYPALHDKRCRADEPDTPSPHLFNPDRPVTDRSSAARLRGWPRSRLRCAPASRLGLSSRIAHGRACAGTL